MLWLGGRHTECACYFGCACTRAGEHNPTGGGDSHWVLLWVTGAVSMGQSLPGSDLRPIAVKDPERREKVSYSREIAELLENKCTGCHG